eukprot:CAMPEP_0170171254 /NCGR_PEP_ID=MMETSP0040_2-20121228/4379_1 /TAXON_ID=641309 /ORGANISM="Lotharella oceanica, Strain CCMP622" /LENGTH=183 /DNA_ID=CAMNT_0010411199 /DNA_START=214 /DNA_END=765 /DNA_ORIENTATION=+
MTTEEDKLPILRSTSDEHVMIGRLIRKTSLRRVGARTGDAIARLSITDKRISKEQARMLTELLSGGFDTSCDSVLVDTSNSQSKRTSMLSKRCSKSILPFVHSVEGKFMTPDYETKDSLYRGRGTRDSSPTTRRSKERSSLASSRLASSRLASSRLASTRVGESTASSKDCGSARGSSRRKII